MCVMHAKTLLFAKVANAAAQTADNLLLVAAAANVVLLTHAT